jgi:hypothetical protein
VQSLDPGHPGDPLGGPVRDSLPRQFREAGLDALEQELLQVRAPFSSFEDWWEPMTFGIGPAGQYVARLDAPGRERLRARSEELLPEPPFELPGDAWCVVARV